MGLWELRMQFFSMIMEHVEDLGIRSSGARAEKLWDSWSGMGVAWEFAMLTWVQLQLAGF